MVRDRGSEFTSRYGDDDQTGFALEHKDERVDYLVEDVMKRLEIEGPGSALDHRMRFLDRMEEGIDDANAVHGNTAARFGASAMEHVSSLEMSYAVIDRGDDLAKYEERDRAACADSVQKTFTK
ncbi:MAG: hypothetical protein OXR67_01750 [Chloroflexota bacterium]|nr:hypothetical protein [Chloroflexota bacterium]